MKQLQLLTAFLINLDLFAPEQLDSWVENPTLTPSGKATTEGGYIIYRQQYDAVITIERYAHAAQPVELIFSHLTAWLMDNDNARSDNRNASINTEVDVLDEQTADIIISIGFYEDVEIVPDVDGPITFNGETFRLAESIIDYAETGDVVES